MHRAELTTCADPATAAWALAALCRDAHPATDPRRGGAAPLVRLGDQHFAIAIGRSGPGDPFRCAVNGRLPRPRARLGDDGTFTWRPPTFEPEPCSIAPGRGDRLEIEIEPIDGGARVRIAAWGDAATPALLGRLEAAIEALSLTTGTADLLRAGDLHTATSRLEAALAGLDARAVSGLGVLLAPLHAHLATARLRGGDLPGARLALSTAVGFAPRVDALRLREAELDARLARTDDASRTLERLASRPLGGPLARIAAGHARAADTARRAAGSALEAHARAQRLLAAGDAEGAAAWSRLAHDLSGGGPFGLEIEVARARGDHRSAFVLGVERLQRFGFDPAIAFAMADDAARYGDPAAGLRVLARHWRALAEHDPARLDRVAGRLADGAGPDLSARVALTEDAGTLLARRLRGEPGGADPLDLPPARLASLRALAARPSGAPPPRLDGFELAPGVAPAR